MDFRHILLIPGDAQVAEDGTVTCTGMYPGKVYHDKVAVKGGAAGGGTYGVEPQGFGRVEVPYNKVK